MVTEPIERVGLRTVKPRVCEQTATCRRVASRHVADSRYTVVMNPLAVVQLLILLAVANGAPVIGRRLLRDRFAWPLDGGIRAFDGRPLLGASKTVRGIVLALVTTTAVAPLIGLTPRIGITVAAVAMAGDLLSSFVKRRFGLRPSSRAVGLDQVPESLLPVLACWHTLMLDVGDIVAVTAIFFIGEIALSRLLYRWRIRERPY